MSNVLKNEKLSIIITIFKRLHAIILTTPFLLHNFQNSSLTANSSKSIPASTSESNVEVQQKTDTGEKWRPEKPEPPSSSPQTPATSKHTRVPVSPRGRNVKNPFLPFPFFFSQTTILRYN